MFNFSHISRIKPAKSLLNALLKISSTVACGVFVFVRATVIKVTNIDRKRVKTSPLKLNPPNARLSYRL